jgi:hypothetical protein
MRFPHLAHRSVAAHKLHSIPPTTRYEFDSGNDETISRLPVLAYSSKEAVQTTGTVATGEVSGNVYLPSFNSGLNQVLDSLYVNGTATIYRDLFCINFQSAISRSTTLPGFGFQNLSTPQRIQQTLQYLNNVSPMCDSHSMVQSIPHYAIPSALSITGTTRLS